MLTPIRRVLTVAVIAMAAAGAAAPAAPLPGGAASAVRHYCAIMTDSIGLYPGNAVTRMGMPVGAVESIDGDTMSVRVTFSLNRRITVPAQVQAVTRTATILADRALELVGGDAATGDLQPGSCIPLERTSTARVNSQAIGAITTLLNQVNGAHGDAGQRLLLAAGSQLDGTGATIAETLALLAGTVGNRGSAATDQRIRSVAALLAGVNTNWDVIERSAVLIPPLMATVTRNVIKPLSDIIGLDLEAILAAVVDAATVYHDLVWNTMSTGTATARLLSQHTGVIVTYGGTFPNMIDWIRRFWAVHHVNPPRPAPVLSPRVDAGGTDDGLVCTRLRPDGKNHCGLFHGIPDGMSTAELLELSLHGGANRP